MQRLDDPGVSLNSITRRAATRARIIPTPDVEPVPDALVRSPLRPARIAQLPRWRTSAARIVPLIAIAAFALAQPAPSRAARMLVLQANETPRLTQTLNALREYAGMPVEVVMLTGARDEALEAGLARGDRGTVIVALGPRASDFVVRLPSPAPVVHCLAGADAVRAGLPAIPSEAPLDSQAAWLRKLVPASRTVGLLFDPTVSTRRAEALGAALAGAGYKTLLQPVASPSAIPAALEGIAGRVDVLMAIPDPTVYAHESARGLLLFSFRKRIPLVGANDAWVRMGALYALDWDYAEVGESCARLAARESKPARALAAPMPSPLRPRVSVNVRSARQFGLNWDAELLRSVDQRHE